MLSLDQFVSDAQGRCLDLDGVFGCQCVDLADAWASNLGSPLPLVGGAVDLVGWTSPAWRWVANGLQNAPSPGDLVVWDRGIGPYGHVALCVGPADAVQFQSLDQNWFGANGMGSDAAFVTHTYFAVAGWLQFTGSGAPRGGQMSWDGSYPMPDPPPASTGVDVVYAGRILPQDGAGNPPHWYDGPDGKDMGAAPIGAGVTTSHAAFDGVNWWDRIAPGTWWLLDSAIDGRDGSHPQGQTPVTAWNEAHGGPKSQPPTSAPDIKTIAATLRQLAHELDGQ